MWKSGGFVYAVVDHQLHVALFVSNNPDFGGDRPQMPKGQPDPGETPLTTARREVMEEIGVVDELVNAEYLLSRHLVGMKDAYVQHCFAFRVDSLIPVATTDEGKGVWLPYEEAVKQIRPLHRPFLEQLHSSLA